MSPARALALAAVFGAVDQYLGSFSAHPWMADVSLLSGPWLVLPFVFGATQHTRRAAVLLGFGSTFAALIGYGLMTLSPLEGAALTGDSAVGFVRSSARVFAGGLLTGPLFGLLGFQWRRRGQAWAGWLAGATLLLEPLARALAGQPIRSQAVLYGELVAAGVLCVLLSGRARALARDRG